MKSVLDPLGAVPGVRMALLATEDGVPIYWTTRRPAAGAAVESDEAGTGEAEAVELAALAAGWFAEATRSVSPLAWNPPARIVLCASRGSIVVAQAPHALLLVTLEEGLSPDAVDLPLNAALARLQRNLRGPEIREARHEAPAVAPSHPADQVPGIFPAPTNVPNPTESRESGARQSSA